jgi:hypothetical protein
LNGKDLSPYLKDCGFWTWFSLLWFEQICRINKSGAFDPYDDCNYILDGNRWGRRQRHCILTTYQIVSRYGEKGRFLLSKLHNRGEILEQIAGTQENLFSKVVIELAHDLYSSSKPGQYFKTGAAGKKGGASRYVTWLNQIRLTFDPNSMTKDDLKALLPKVEYQRFLK